MTATATAGRRAGTYPRPGMGGWDGAHGGPALARERSPGYDDEGCGIDGCGRPRYARQPWCEPHYRRWRRHGDPEGGGRPDGSDPPPCAVEGCGLPADAQGWCHGHHQRWLRRSDVMAHEPLQRRKQPEACEVEGCPRQPHASGLCQPHYHRVRTTGRLDPHVPIRTPVGEGSLSHGYRKVPVPPELRHLTNGETPIGEHRLVMAMHLGRSLEPDETVHHRNGVRTDNRIENLELWSTWQPSGQRVIDKVRWAIELLRLYAPHVLSDEEGAP